MQPTAWIAMLLFVPALAATPRDAGAQHSLSTPGFGMFAFGSPKEAAPPEPPACPAKFDDSLEGNGIAGDFRHGVTPPKATVSPAAELSERARKEAHKKHFLNAVSVLSMIVGEDGVPRDVCLKQAAGLDLDAQAAKAALKYRFEPATKDGKPVPARISLEVNFRAY